MEPLNIDPNQPYVIEIIEDNQGKYDPPFCVPGFYSREQIKEYVSRMNEDTVYEIFRVWCDGTHTEITKEFTFEF
jgi:hypothetical protein